MFRTRKKTACFFLAVILLFSSFSLISCEKATESASSSDATRISFKSALSYDTLSALNGKKVTINGYMATSSPVDGSYLYLMNMPYQSCPFCKPNTSELSNTMAVYAKKNSPFDYTDQAITVTGTLSVAPEGKPFSDDYGYEFSFKLVDADYVIMQSEDMDAKTALWQKFSETTLPSDLDKMFNFVNFLCLWPTYFVNSTEDYTGYYLYPGDAQGYLDTENNRQYAYGMADGYFEKLIARVKKISETELNDLVKIIEDAQALAEDAYNDLVNGEYTYETKYVEKFGTTDKIFTLNNADALEAENDRIWSAYSNWLASWEM